MKLEQAFQKGSFKLLLRTALSTGVIHRAGLSYLERKIRQKVIDNPADNRPLQVRQDKYDMCIALLHRFIKGVNKGYISRRVLNRLLDTFLDNVLFGDAYQQATARLGFDPPLFVLVSPGKRCNLHCTGCYACSDSHAASHLDRDTFDRILTEKEDLWGSYFTVISGGEPFLWADGGTDLLDMVAQHPNQYFLVYTNSTLINKNVAERLAQLGNVTPAISVEGFAEQTDQRRGKGVHKKILQAMENLRKAGVPFGISVTATRNNAELVTSDEFVDFYFEQQGATYGWLFQYMPIGRKHTLDMMVTPQQRLKMLNRTWSMVKQRRLFVADFWNSGTSSNGCISAGRPGGYFYINWDGDITPCAFVPYSDMNIYDVYKNGGTLDDVLFSPFFQKIRNWQNKYGYAQSPEKTNNWLCPCVIRDHYDVFHNYLIQTHAKPIDNEAAQAINDTQYKQGLINYGKDFYQLTDKIWQENYTHTPLKPETCAVV